MWAVSTGDFLFSEANGLGDVLMTDNAPRLVEPSESLETEYRDCFADFAAVGEQDMHGGSMNDGEDFATFLQRLRNESQGIGLPDGWVSSSTFWLVADGRMIGRCNVRHRLTEPLLDFGGHIGYSIRPSDRRNGHGALELRLALEKAWALGIERVRITCDRDNIGSVRVIEKNGGILDTESYSPHSHRVTRRYWIDRGGV